MDEWLTQANAQELAEEEEEEKNRSSSVMSHKSGSTEGDKVRRDACACACASTTHARSRFAPKPHQGRQCEAQRVARLKTVFCGVSKVSTTSVFRHQNLISSSKFDA